MRRSGFILLLAGLALAGFGCKDPNQLRSAQALRTDDVQTNPETPVGPRPEDYEEHPQPDLPTPGELPQLNIPPEVVLVRQAMNNLSLADRYRADIYSKDAQGETRAELAFNRRSGMFGRLTLSNATSVATAEMYTDGTVFAFRGPNGKWETVGNTPEANRLLALFRLTILRPGGGADAVATYATVEGQGSEPNCTRYDLKQYATGGLYQRYAVCVANELPLWLVFKNEDGDLRIDYREVNGSVDVFNPLNQ